MKFLDFIHRWENRNTFLAYSPGYISDKIAISLAKSMHMGILPVEGLKEQVKIVTKPTNLSPERE